MNKWIILFATMLLTLSFAMTIGTTISNPSLSNVVISGFLFIVAFFGFSIFLKSKKKKENEFEPVRE